MWVLLLLEVMAGAATADELVAAMDVPMADVLQTQLTGSPNANDVVTHLGILLPSEGSDMVLLSSGNVRRPQSPVSIWACSDPMATAPSCAFASWPRRPPSRLPSTSTFYRRSILST